MKEIARAKRLAVDHQDFTDRLRDNVPARPVPSKSQWKKLERDVGAPLEPGSAGSEPLLR